MEILVAVDCELHQKYHFVIIKFVFKITAWKIKREFLLSLLKITVK